MSQDSIAIYLTNMRIGGAQRVARNLCKGFLKKGYEVDLVLVEAVGGLLTQVPGEVTIVELNASRVLTSIRPLQAYLSTQQPEILYSMMTEPNLAAIAAHRLARSDTKLVLSEHNMLSRSAESIKDKLVSAGVWGTYTYADKVVVVSKGVRDDLLAHTRLTGDDIHVIYNPIDVEEIYEQSADRVGHKWFDNDSLDVILAGGRHETQKGFDTLLSAFSRIEDPDTRLMIFGDGPERSELQRQAASLGIDNRVHFPGFIKNPFAYMRSADVFVLSSTYEGFGLVLIEALACGCPVVSTDCESGPAEILNGGEYGLIVPVGDAMMLSNAIVQTLKDPIQSKTLRGRADDFDIPSITFEYHLLFTSQ